MLAVMVSRPAHKTAEAFLDAYLRELAFMRDLTGPQVVHSIFFGGGTPSLMQPATTAAIIDAIGRL